MSCVNLHPVKGFSYFLFGVQLKKSGLNMSVCTVTLLPPRIVIMGDL